MKVHFEVEIYKKNGLETPYINRPILTIENAPTRGTCRMVGLCIDSGEWIEVQAINLIEATRNAINNCDRP